MSQQNTTFRWRNTATNQPPAIGSRTNRIQYQILQHGHMKTTTCTTKEKSAQQDETNVNIIQCHRSIVFSTDPSMVSYSAALVSVISSCSPFSQERYWLNLHFRFMEINNVNAGMKYWKLVVSNGRFCLPGRMYALCACI